MKLGRLKNYFFLGFLLFLLAVSFQNCSVNKPAQQNLNLSLAGEVSGPSWPVNWISPTDTGNNGNLQLYYRRTVAQLSNYLCSYYHNTEPELAVCASELNTSTYFLNSISSGEQFIKEDAFYEAINFGFLKLNSSNLLSCSETIYLTYQNRNLPAINSNKDVILLLSLDNRCSAIFFHTHTDDNPQ